MHGCHANESATLSRQLEIFSQTEAHEVTPQVCGWVSLHPVTARRRRCRCFNPRVTFSNCTLSRKAGAHGAVAGQAGHCCGTQYRSGYRREHGRQHSVDESTKAPTDPRNPTAARSSTTTDHATHPQRYSPNTIT